MLVAYAKLVLKRDLIATGLPDDPWFERTLRAYFPPELVERYGDRLQSHPLRREIVVNSVVNSMVNRGGITFAFRAEDETAADAEQVARAYLVGSRGVRPLRVRRRRGGAGQQGADGRARPSSTWSSAGCWTGRSAGSSRTGRRQLDIAAEVEQFRETVRAIEPRLPRAAGRAPSAAGWSAGPRSWSGSGHRRSWPCGPRRCWTRSRCSTSRRSPAETGVPADEVAPVYFTLSERYGVDAMLGRITALPREDRWDALARGVAAHRPVRRAGVAHRRRAALDAATGDPQHRIAAWEKANAAALARARKTDRGGHGPARPQGIAALSVALRSLRAVIRSGTATS